MRPIEDIREQDNKEKTQQHATDPVNNQRKKWKENKRQREEERATEIAPAGAVCWEQVVYLGQHIASSAFLPTCLSKRRRGQPARRAALLRVPASALDVSTVHAVSHADTETHCSDCI